jgi:hypothetical protein
MIRDHSKSQYVMVLNVESKNTLTVSNFLVVRNIVKSISDFYVVLFLFELKKIFKNMIEL